MSAPEAVLGTDPLLAEVDAATQRQAAQLAQDAFARVFRLSVGEDDDTRQRGVAQLHRDLRDWAAVAATPEARALRMAMLLSGMDQWGLAWSAAFELVSIPGLTELIGALRTDLDAEDDARLLRAFDAINAAEENAIQFKVELRRGVHVALWHSSIAGDDREQAMQLSARLGGMLLAVVRDMPVAGWRLVADALAFIQIRCLADGLAADGIGRDATQALFAALARELPVSTRDAVQAHASNAVLAWQQAARAAGGVH